MNWVDWLFIGIILISGWKGMHNGLLSSLSRLIGICVGLLLAYTGYKQLSEYFNTQLGWGSAITSFLIARVPLPVLEQLNQKISFFTLMLAPFQNQSATPADYGLTVQENLVNLVNQLSASLLDLLSFIMLLFGGALIIFIILRLFSSALSHSIFRPVDRLGGLVLGLARGVLIILILTIVTQPFSLFNNTGSSQDDRFVGNGAKSSILLPYATGILKSLHLSIPISPLANKSTET